MRNDKISNLESHAFGDVHDIVFSMIDHFVGKNILDAATGTGCLAYRLIEKGHIVTAADLNPVTNNANIKIDNINLNEKSKYSDNSFDLITHIETFEHLRNPGLCLSEFFRILKPEGILILSAPNIVNIQSRIIFLLTGQYHNFFNFESSYKYANGNDRHILALTPWLIKIFLKNSGFTILEERYSLGGVEIPTKKKPWLKLVFLPRLKIFGNSVIIKAQAIKK